MGKCETVGCEGHLGKFDDCISEAVWGASLEWADDSVGDSDWGHYAIIEFSEAELVEVYPGANREVTVPSGTYIVYTASSGLVHVQHYANRDDAEYLFAGAVGDWQQYESGDE